MLVLLAGALALGIVVAPGGGFAMPASLRIPKVAPHGEDDPREAALFSHWGHDRFKCYRCHPSIFPQRRVGFTHEDLDAGRYCASCHDGKRAWAFDEAECEICHVP
jgi:c(7)-type cytochrome triheme protein